MISTGGLAKALARLLLLSALIGLLILLACGSTPAEYNLRYACLHRNLSTCAAAEEFAARVADRTDGRVRIEVTTANELNISWRDLLPSLKQGTLEMAEIYLGNFFEASGNEPFYTQKTYSAPNDSILEIGNLWGLFNDQKTQTEVIEAIRDDMARIVSERTGGVVLAFQFYPSNYFFTKKPLRKPTDIQGLKVRSHNKALDDLLEAMGATADPTRFDSVYQAFESDQLDAAVSCSSCGAELGWPKVTGYLVGPIVGLSYSWMTISSRVWEQLPQDVQTIILEEAKRHEEATRKDSLAVWDQRGVRKNIGAGMERINLTPEMNELMRTAALTTVLPNWVQRGGGADSEAVKLFNQKIAAIVKVEITEDGEAREIE